MLVLPVRIFFPICWEIDVQLRTHSTEQCQSTRLYGFMGLMCISVPYMILHLPPYTASSHSPTTGHHCIGLPLPSVLSLCAWCNSLFNNLCNLAIFSAFFLNSLCFLFLALSFFTTLHSSMTCSPTYCSW